MTERPVRYMLLFESSNSAVAVMLGYLVGQSLSAAVRRFGWENAFAYHLGAKSLVRSWGERDDEPRESTGVRVTRVLLDRLGLDELFSHGLCAKHADEHGRYGGDCRRLLQKLRTAVYDRSIVEQVASVEMDIISIPLDDVGMRPREPADGRL